MIVIADTTPLNYLVLIGEIDVLPALYGRVIVPRAVYAELVVAGSPGAVRTWANRLPNWVEVHNAPPEAAALAPGLLDPGEGEAIALARLLKPNC
jgi:predicted nucleic acid-binding protein